MSSRVVLIGIDGASHPLLEKWMDAGVLPNLARVRGEGAFGALQSTVHPISPIAWASIVTGVNAGKHGVFDFFERENNSYRFRTVNAASRKAPAIWDILGGMDRESVVFNVPCTFPPRPTKGAFVSGLLTPGRNSKFTYPPDLKEKILSKVPDYRVPGEDAVFAKGDEQRYVRQLIQSIDCHEKACLELINLYPNASFYMFVFMQVDAMTHKMWKAVAGLDSPQEMQALAKSVYQRMDQAVGRVMSEFSADTNVLIVSDHGGGELKKMVAMNRWLMERGFLVLKKSLSYEIRKWIGKTRMFSHLYQGMARLGLGRVAKMIPGRWQTEIAKGFTGLGDVDWSKTKAYAYGKYGQIYINLKGREQCGIVRPEDAEDLLLALEHELYLLEDPENGARIVSKVYRGKDLYQGPYQKYAADLVFEMGGYAYDTTNDPGFSDRQIFKKPEFNDCGTHRLEGVVFARGPSVKKKAHVGAATVLDIAPSVLRCLGVTAPESMEGNVLSVFESKKEMIAAAGTYGEMKHADADADLTEAEEKAIEERLRSLGYLG